MFARSRRGVDGLPRPTPGVRGAQKTAVRTKLPLWRKRAPLNGRRPLPLVYSAQLERKTKTATQPSTVATQLKHFIINVPYLHFFTHLQLTSLFVAFSHRLLGLSCVGGNVKFTAEYWRVIAAYESTKQTQEMLCFVFLFINCQIFQSDAAGSEAVPLCCVCLSSLQMTLRRRCSGVPHRLLGHCKLTVCCF